MSSIIPAVVENHLDSIQCWEDGKLLLGSSNLTGRYWNGTLICFKAVEDAPDIEKCYTGIGTQYGISDVVCLSDKRAAIGLDSGAVELYRLHDNCTPTLVLMSSCCEHDSTVSSLSVNCDESRLVSGGFEKCVKVWDLQSLSSIATYRPICSGMVLQVACSMTDPNILLACCQDGKLLLLDLRLPKPATSLSTSPLESMPCSAAWKRGENTKFAVGDDSGYITVKDIRNDVGGIFQCNPHTRAIYRLAFSPANGNWLASCSDNTDVVVTNVQNSLQKCSDTIYEDNRHNDYVRGLVWYPDNDLISCGWDKKVLKHKLPPMKIDETSESAGDFSSC